MVFIRLCSFMFMLMFCLVEARNSIYHYKQPHSQGVLDPKVAPQSEKLEPESIHLTTISKGIRSTAVQVEKDESKMRLNGRKLTSKEGFKKEKGERKDQTKMTVNGRSSKKSGATTPSSSWKCNNRVKRKSDHNVLCKQINVRSGPKKAMLPNDSIAALSTADYHYPNPHPPRHN